MPLLSRMRRKLEVFGMGELDEVVIKMSVIPLRERGRLMFRLFVLAARCTIHCGLHCVHFVDGKELKEACPLD